MAFREVSSLESDTTISLGGKDKQGKSNPVKLIGYYLGSKTVPSAMSKTGTCKIHVFQTPNGTTGVWGKTDLDRKIAAATLGALTMVTYTGLQSNPKPGRKPMYLYSVKVNEENVIEVAAPPSDSAVEDEVDAGYVTPTSSYGDEPEEADVGDDEAAPDEVTPARASPPRTPAAAPSLDAQARIKALVAKTRTRAA